MSKSLLGDIRLEGVLRCLLSRQTTSPSVVIRQLGGSRAEEVRYGRFLSNESYSVKVLGSYLLDNQCLAVSGRHVLSIQDTTEVDLSHRGSEELGLGSIGNGLGYGYYLHPHLLVDANSKEVLGLGSISHHIREDKRAAYQAEAARLSKLSEAERKAEGKRKRQERDRVDGLKTLEQKEGYRWLESGRESLSRLGDAECVTVLADCETDTYEYLVGLSDPAFKPQGSPLCHLIVRSDNNRQLDIRTQVYNAQRQVWVKKNECLYDYLSKCSSKGELSFEVAQTPTRTKRVANFELKFERVKIRCPSKLRGKRSFLEGKALPKFMDITVVQLREVGTTPPGEKPICWVLLTTHEVQSIEDACQIIEYYRLRWRIEIYFKLLKSSGFRIEDILLKTKDAILKLTFISLMAAINIIQMLQAREEPSLPIDPVFSQQEQEVLHKILPMLQGKTDKSKNPYPPDSLAYATWIIARLGGWKGYNSERKPGITTLNIGINRFYDFCTAFALAQNE